MALYLQEQVDDFFQWHIPVVWTVIVAPAHMDSYLFRRDATEGIVEHFHALLQMSAKLLDADIGKTNVALHGQVRTIQLQREAGRNDSLIFIAHSVREG